MPSSHQKTVSVRNISLDVTEVRSGKRIGSVRISGKKDGKYHVFGTAKNMKLGIEKARKMCQKLDQDAFFTLTLSKSEIDVCRYVVQHHLKIEDLTPVVSQKSKIKQAKLIEVTEEWLSQKLQTNTFSSHYVSEIKFAVKSLNQYFGNPTISRISTSDLEDFLEDLKVGIKRRKNIHTLVGNIWRWALARKFLLENEASTITNPKIRRKTGGHAVIVPEQFAIMLANVQESFLPWLAIGGFAGLRGSEIYGSPKFELDRLKWADFDWKNKRISVRPETSKTDLHRFVPICEALESWLKPWKRRKGFVHTCPRPTSAKRKMKHTTETSGPRLITARSSSS